MSDSDSEAPVSPVPEPPVGADQPSNYCSTCGAGDTPAVVECLACKASYCSLCSASHLQPLSTRHHRLIPLAQLPVCPKHHMEAVLYCWTCESTCCLVCSTFSCEHKGHDVCDLETAGEQKMMEWKEITGKLRDMKKKLDLKVDLYEKQRREVEKTQEIMKKKVKNAVLGLVKELNCVFDTEIAALNSVSDPILLTLDQNLSHIFSLQAASSGLAYTNMNKSSLIGRFAPGAQSLLASVSELEVLNPVRSGEEWKDTGKLELAADIWWYGVEMRQENRWECRKCRNRNFLKTSVCRKCGLVNRLLQRLGTASGRISL